MWSRATNKKKSTIKQNEMTCTWRAAKLHAINLFALSAFVVIHSEKKMPQMLFLHVNGFFFITHVNGSRLSERGCQDKMCVWKINEKFTLQCMKKPTCIFVCSTFRTLSKWTTVIMSCQMPNSMNAIAQCTERMDGIHYRELCNFTNCTLTSFDFDSITLC